MQQFSRRMFRRVAASSTLAMVAAATPAFGQTVVNSQATGAAQVAANQPDPDVQQQDGTDPGSINDIVVTAQRREERLQDVPLSITALTGEQLQQNNVTDINRLEQLTPGLRIARSGSDARPALRGIITEAIGANSDPRIGFYVDDIYQSRTSQGLAAFVDLERVEVQKGPQGTLYGRNSLGGNIAVFSAVPRDTLSYGVSALYGSYNRARVEGFLNLPLATDLAVRFAGSYDRMDGYVRNTSTGSDLGDEDAAYGRVILRWQPSGSGLDVQLRASYYTQGGAGISAFGYKSVGTTIAPDLQRQPGGSITLPNGRVLTFPNGFNGTAFESSLAGAIQVPFNSRFRDGIPDINGADIGVPIETDPFRINFDANVNRDTEQAQFSALIDYELGRVRLRSISSYTDFYALRQSDNDFSPAPLAVDSNLTKVETYTQELQLLSNDPGSPFEWIVGGFYFNDRVEEFFYSDNLVPGYPVAGQPALSFFSNTLLPGAAFPNNTPITGARSDNLSPVLASTESYAGFVQASYTFFDRLRVTAGYRYTSDRKEYAAGVGVGATQNPATPSVAPYFVFDLNQPINYTCPAAGSTSPLFGNNPALPSSTAGNTQNALGIQCGERTFNFSTWRGAVDYKITEDSMVYASVSRGARSGGFNNVLNPLTGQTIEFFPEFVTAYEIGSKNQFLDNTLQLNIAAFFNDYTALQQQRSSPAPNGLTVLSFIENSGASEAYGIEFDAIYRPVPELTLQVALNYLKATERELVSGTFNNGLCGVIAGGCPAPAALPANPTAAQIAAYNAALAANAFGIGPQGAPFPNPVTDPNRFIQVFLPNGQAAAVGGLPVYNYVIAGLGADGTTRFTSPAALQPEFTAQIGASYDIAFAGGTLTPSFVSYFSSEYLNTLFTRAIGVQESFTRTDIRLTYLTANENVTVQAFVENIENSAPLHRVAFGGNRSLNGVYGTPRMYGIRASLRF